MRINIDGEFLNNLKCVDDIVLIADSFDQAQTMLQELHAITEKVSLLQKSSLSQTYSTAKPSL